jgi:hypothetical protein
VSFSIRIKLQEGKTGKRKNISKTVDKRNLTIFQKQIISIFGLSKIWGPGSGSATLQF